MPTTAFEGTDEDWDDGWRTGLQVNVLEPASLIREAVNHFLEHGGGTVITLSSWAAQRGSAIRT
jgi:NAD(P)-dependent dehydrogenase (short-subunit alcohol dehydrogenase family)